MKIRKRHIMFSRTLATRGNETNRFSPNPTLSDFPLLIGEMLHRAELRAEKKAKAAELRAEKKANAARSLVHKIRFTIS
jgi:energy-coupling factor transporter transmembrane protein EcfT